MRCSNADAIVGVAAVYFARGQSDAAIAGVQAGNRSDFRRCTFYVACAEMLFGLSRFPQAAGAGRESLLQKAVKLTPHRRKVTYLLGQLAMQQSSIEGCRNICVTLRASDPDRSKGAFCIVRCLQKDGTDDDATKELHSIRT